MFQWRKRMLANVERARIERLAKEIGRASRAWSLPALVRNYEGQPPPRWSTAPDRRYLPLRRAAGDPEQGKTDGHLHEADRPDCMTSRGAWRTGKPPVSKAGQRVARAGVHAGVGPPVSTLERTHSPAVTAGLAGRPSTSPARWTLPGMSTAGRSGVRVLSGTTLRLLDGVRRLVRANEVGHHERRGREGY